MSNKIKKYFPKFESGKEDTRIETIKDWMTKNLEENPLYGDEKYAVISHKYTIAFLTAHGIDPKDRLGVSGYKFLENVEMLPFNNF